MTIRGYVIMAEREWIVKICDSGIRERVSRPLAMDRNFVIK